MVRKLQWGILAAGSISRAFAKSVRHSTSGELAAVGSRSLKKAEKFGKEFGVSRCYGSYEELLADAGVQAVYISTPHPYHAEWAIKAARAGKHILCEKPLTLNHGQAMAVVEAAREHDVFLMEAFMYRCHPQTAKLVELLRSGLIGEVRMIQANFSFHAEFSPESRLFNNRLGGGGILDVGCYPISMARLVAGTATGGTVAEPLEVKGLGHCGTTGVDEWAIGILRFPGDILAQVATGVSLTLENTVRIFGAKGNILLASPWLPAREGGTVEIIVQRAGENPEHIPVRTEKFLYEFEADIVAEHLASRQAPFPAMSWADSLGNMKTLDAWRLSFGMVYESEQPGARTAPVHGGPLAVRKDAPMLYGKIAGLDIRPARLFLGVDNQMFLPDAAVMFDDYFERGGNAFDTAFIYGGGVCEQLLGQWVKDRGVRKQVVLVGKGAHTPFCTPEHLTSQLLTTLERLQTDYLDIYLMHRDNTAVPVEEFMDVLNEHQNKGRYKIFGVSNWTIERIEAANRYAKKKGIAGIVVLSHNLSLADMVSPVWEGCLSFSDKTSRQWLAAAQIPLLAWSSQARGFFVRAQVPRPGSEPDKSDPELKRCWYSPDNFSRLARSRELAAKKGVEPIHIALAYVLHQEFPTFALIGPRTIAETRSSCRALAVSLTPEECAWLRGDE